MLVSPQLRHHLHWMLVSLVSVMYCPLTRYSVACVVDEMLVVGCRAWPCPVAIDVLDRDGGGNG